MNKKIRILLADDHKIFLDGLKDLLIKEENFSVIAIAENGLEVLELIPQSQPDIIIMDVTMPGLNGIEATRIISKKYPNIKIIALSMHSDKRIISEILSAGARGYILKECSISEFVQGIKTVMEENVYLTPKVSTILLEDYLRLRNEAFHPQENKLSPREAEVLKLLVEGKNTKKIASELSISKNTVDTHRRNIMDKLGCANMAELTRYALREGLVDLDEDL
ncbi:Transcriptional regulatory protein DegU [bioreactor metagenome]|jgi:DNA-binding NarL/FixJ family response regulator|uniref:Transcriptional regulatory protein DegU n=1 Tax=bioreactor metagenome TaxID=1076179 RepID=A0A645CUF5_9ZZZZ|nr:MULTISPECIES: response regulator transcription factor [unclassified Aminobacterium]MDD2206464.1 response regulator transcription factor [Aminobacterium sp.]MDD4228201.1 response regulator transcription factor [Aminobacterium sp.]MEA4878526.1 response regulator transcription factor [Aminobacterium sp.]WMI70925.1 response regulator transcription factor [Aminobacterium sp. MB27-C1]